MAACADHHYLVSKSTQSDGRTASSVLPVSGEARVAEVARMLGGERMAGTSLAHAQAMLAQAAPGQIDPAAGSPDDPLPKPGRRRSKA